VFTNQARSTKKPRLQENVLSPERKALSMNNPTMTAAARLAARLLAHRQTSQEEIGDLIRTVHDAVSRLNEAPATQVEAEDKREEAAASPVRQKRPRRAAAEPTATEPAVPEAAAEDEARLAATLAPKLVRRAEVAPAAPAAPSLAAPPHHGAVRGVVRWFDPKSGKGALRLPGLGDVGFDARVLAESGISRLFKGQEIEATLSEGAPTPQIQRLSVPGAVSAHPLGGGVVKGRQARPVVVELKREALRRAAARAEAEHVLGSPRSR
jgi:cold shock CspA family protein